MESAFLSASAAAESAHTVSGTVRIGAPDGFGSVFLAARMHRLTSRHPGLEVEIMATARIFSLSKREADIVVSLSPPQQARVIARRLTDYRLFVYGPKPTSPAIRKSAPPPTSKGIPSSATSRICCSQPGAELSRRPRPAVSARLRSTNLLAQVHATLGGAGLCILPAFIAAGASGAEVVLPEAVSLTRAFHMHIHEDHRQAAPIRAVAAFIAGEVEAARDLFEGAGLPSPRCGGGGPREGGGRGSDAQDEAVPSPHSPFPERRSPSPDSGSNLSNLGKREPDLGQPESAGGEHLPSRGSHRLRKTPHQPRHRRRMGHEAG